MKLVRSVVTCAIAQRLGHVAEDDLLVGDDARQAHGVDRHLAPAASAISCAVRAAVPDGASSLAGWWYSTISAACMCRAASAAKRIIRTAPMAKLGATKHVARRARDRGAQVVDGEARSSR